MTASGDNDQPRPGTPGGQEHEHVIEGIRALHGRIDELEQLLRAAGHQEARDLPRAWQKVTDGEQRWPVALCTAAGIALQVAVPASLVLVRPAWILPAAQGVLLLGLIAANPDRINNESRVLRVLALALAGLLTLANVWSVARLAVTITHSAVLDRTPSTLLVTGAVIWLTNVIAFGLWYWEFDRGGPAARAHNVSPYPDFQFAQMTSPEMAPHDWEPAFVDYLYLAFTNGAAFSPTDVMPMSRWAKLAMTVQSVISIVTVALVISRAVNILP